MRHFGLLDRKRIYRTTLDKGEFYKVQVRRLMQITRCTTTKSTYKIRNSPDRSG